jgi:hypothetical protein
MCGQKIQINSQKVILPTSPPLPLHTAVAESLYTLCSNIRLFTLYWRIVLAYRKEKGVLFVQIFLC